MIVCMYIACGRSRKHPGDKTLIVKESFWHLNQWAKLAAFCFDLFSWASAWQNLQNGMCAQRRSAWASAQSDQSLLCAQRVAKDPSFLHADSEDWSVWADAQDDLGLRLGYMPFCRFGHLLAHLTVQRVTANRFSPWLFNCKIFVPSLFTRQQMTDFPRK